MNAFSMGLPRYAVFSSMLAFVGLPIYIHAPKFFVDHYGVSLTAIGTALLVVRLLDFIQDPLLGWWADRLKTGKSRVVTGAGAILAVSLLMLFARQAPISPVLWFMLCIAVLFTAFSLLTILFYAQGIQKAKSLGPKGHVQVAAWRETGALIGICCASLAPLGLQWLFPNTDHPFTLFAVFFTSLAVFAIWSMRTEWTAHAQKPVEPMFPVLYDPVLRRLFYVAFLNAAPVAVTASLFLFFVEYRLGSVEAAGPLLMAFFLSAAVAAPLWGVLAQRFAAKSVLLTGMALSIAAFAFALTLETGDITAFAIVCVASGAALGADMTLLPALFARRVAAISETGGQAFGLWNFCTKATLALAAVTMLPILEAAGFVVGQSNPPSALYTLTILYALVPCGLKLMAFVCLACTKLKEG